MPKITINGKTVEVKEGSTIIHAYKALGEDIAHYCWHPGLKVAGVCRLCMVEVQGNSKLQIACNTPVTDGMVVNNNSEKVKDTVKWGLDFHLINHPLDCPICDQAGECGLQDQYMQFGKYDPEMAEKKVKKRKVVDLGERVVLDTERCILCSRCVRFTEEVSKTNELGIFNRGDRSEIGTFADKPLNNNYSVNTVDICPVGALTSKDFRFKQRVWYLQNKETVCQGCSTGCSVNMYFNEEGVFRVKPVLNEEVNGYWMCDQGRDVYKFINRPVRLMRAKTGKGDNWEYSSAGSACKSLSDTLKKLKPEDVGLVLTGQYSNEEYEAMLQFFVKDFGSKNVYHWQNQPEKVDEFDGILFRGDRNPNTAGLKAALKKFGVSTKWDELKNKVSQFKLLIVAGPENIDPAVFPDLHEKVKMLGKAQQMVWLSACDSTHFADVDNSSTFIPVKTYVEKDGSFTNHAGKTQNFSRILTVIAGALTLSEVATLLAGQDLTVRAGTSDEHLKTNFFWQNRGSL